MEDDKLIPLSYISQYCYCKRRVGLLMLEQQWNDSVDTAKGTMEHNNVHTSGQVKRSDICTITDMQVISRKMNLAGKCDAVEAIEDENGVGLGFIGNGHYRLYPIEYKHGKLRSEEEYELQLCGQAMCLEEMFSCQIEKGAIFYISSHRRKEIILTEKMREKVEEISNDLMLMLESSKVPEAVSSPKCMRCSLKDICMPETEKTIGSYMKKLRKEISEGD